ncbi:MAG: iron ABC transporter permease [Gammaproteobacteria bacterium]|nr:iron ABC transporter permease [Gammaproteobacteria bacterium]MDP2140152.1 iron ABC transporter permease [Gammaproteobacteria bacterium]MDP2347128.1 iron ABC transporter permease [Gammaproteobacteria bacterium]
MIQRHHYILLALLLVLTAVSFLISFSSGSVDLGIGAVLRQLINPEPGLERQILFELRIPRSIAAFLTGGLLALSGVIMQVLLRNPLADPYILGISGGAAVAALASILLGFSGIWISNAAFCGALFSILIVFGLARSQNSWSATRLLLTGVVISAGWGAMINILLTTSANNSVYSMLFWLMGDLSQSSAGITSALVLLSGFLLMMMLATSLNVLTRGDLQAASLGVNVARLKLILYFSASVLTACAVTIAGSIGFVGLVIPHMLRLLGARDHRVLIPASILLGGSFLMIADSFARSIIAPQQLPVGVVTAIIGVPAFLLILRRTRPTLE